MSGRLPLVEPVLPVLVREVPRGPEWCYELKLDGFRGTLYVDGGAAQFRSKTKRRMARFAALAHAIASELAVTDAIIDGEIVVLGERGPDFYALMFHRGIAQFAAFDLLWLNGRDLRQTPYRNRKALLRRLLKPRRIWISPVDSHATPALFDAAARMDLEGVVAKRRDDPYGAGARWLKVKHRGYSQAEGRGELFHPGWR